MDQDTRARLIQQYKEGYASVAAALEGITPAELDSRPAPGKWSPREIVHHLADSEMTSAIRLRLLMAEDAPLIRGYDQDEFARRLFYDRPYTSSLEAFRAARQATGEILDRMQPADWRREGTHTEIGGYSAQRWLEIYAVHAHNHADQIRAARATVTGE
jgi:hypothetical protein